MFSEDKAHFLGEVLREKKQTHLGQFKNLQELYAVKPNVYKGDSHKQKEMSAVELKKGI